jgi:hypothetical protein
MGLCRLCGAECAESEMRAVEVGAGCRSCNGSPACARCGHARRQHRGTFGGGEPGCKARAAADMGLTVGRCGCDGYTTDSSEALEAVPLVELIELRLRRPGDPVSDDAPRLAPVRDLLDEGRRVRHRSEADGLPWRPPN